MGKAGPENHADGPAAPRSSRPSADADGQPDSRRADGPVEGEDHPAAPGQGDQAGQTARRGAGHAVAAAGPVASLHEFIEVYRSVEDLKKALEAVRANINNAVGAGMDRDVIMEAIRLDSSPLERRFNVLKGAAELLEAIGARSQIELLVCVDDPVGHPTGRMIQETDQGFFAASMGLPITENPYPPGTKAHNHWSTGHTQAGAK